VQIAVEAHAGDEAGDGEVGQRASFRLGGLGERGRPGRVRHLAVDGGLQLERLPFHVQAHRQPVRLPHRLGHSGKEQGDERIRLIVQGLLEPGDLFEYLQVDVRRGHGIRPGRLFRGLVGGHVGQSLCARVLPDVDHGFQRVGLVGEEEAVPDDRMRLVRIERPPGHAPILGRSDPARVALFLGVLPGEAEDDLVQLVEHLGVFGIDHQDDAFLGPRGKRDPAAYQLAKARAPIRFQLDLQIVDHAHELPEAGLRGLPLEGG